MMPSSRLATARELQRARLLVGCEVDGLGPAGHTQARSNSALARGQQAAHHENKHMLPTGCSKAGTPRLQPLAQDLGNGIADNGLVLVQHPKLRILTEARCNAWAVAMRRGELDRL